MKVIFKGQVPKDLSYPESMEDAMAFSASNDRIAISDGASESFDSKIWAQLLVDNFITKTYVNQTWLNEIIEQFAANFNLASMSWSKAAAFERGSFATLLGIEIFQERQEVEIISVGDSLAVLLDGAELVKTFTYQSFDQFQQRPTLFCSNLVDNKFIQEPNFYSLYQTTWNLGKLRAPKILCMTDALSEWALRKAAEDNPQWEFLLGISDDKILTDFVMHERANRTMKVDDITLVSIEFKGVDENELPLT